MNAEERKLAELKAKQRLPPHHKRLLAKESRKRERRDAQNMIVCETAAAAVAILGLPDDVNVHEIIRRSFERRRRQKPEQWMERIRRYLRGETCKVDKHIKGLVDAIARERLGVK
jgi:hypothetical protein